MKNQPKDTAAQESPKQEIPKQNKKTVPLDTVPTSILIVSPVYGGTPMAYHNSVLRAITAPSIHQISYQPLEGVSLLQKARNQLATWFLSQTKFEWLLMVDSDMEFTIQDIERIVSRGKPLIGGLYKQRIQQDTPIYVLNALEKDFEPTKEAVQQVQYVGTGFMLIHRSVLMKMINAFPEMEYFSDINEGQIKHWDFFSPRVVNKRYLSEDWFFCHRWLMLGGKVYVDCETKLKHHGTAVYE